MTFENALEIDFNDFKEKTALNDTNEYMRNIDEIKSLENPVPPTIEYNGKKVWHGKAYIRENYIYGGENINYLKEVTNYSYGKKDGLSEVFFINKGTRYLKEEINYKNGLKEGKYIKYFTNNVIWISGQYINDIEVGSWIHKHFDNSTKYLFNYDGVTATRTEYESDQVAANYNRKGKVLSVANFKYFPNNNGGEWKEHGSYIWYGSNNDIIQSKYFYKGSQSSKKEYASKVQNESNSLNEFELTEAQAKEIFYIIFGKKNPLFIKNLGHISKTDIKKAKEYLELILKQTCGMHYFEEIMRVAVTPGTRTLKSIDDIIEAFLKGVFLCDDKIMVQGVVTEFSRTHKSEFNYRMDYKEWPVN
ncbi:toxin-antitoxin system YwqK family antitoxin [Xanthomarina sp. F2636L]|uniref:toxin-antitoxin system YwqK family antitoxin n=1 Tax=Xanthomarina sp. F2636L TaxID=2996018 RepID=UPI00225DD918|nr:hypothetical protein [Xanthomarina sp. F2636L]